MIAADSIRLAYGRRVILDDVAIRIPDRGVTGLLGLNGSGKTSLLHVLYGDLRPQYAYVEVDGSRTDRPLWKTPGLLNMAGQAMGIPRQFSANRLIRLHGLDPDLFWSVHGTQRDKLVDGIRHGSLSKVRRFLTLLLLMAPTRYTFLDEPFAGLAPLSVDYLHHHLRLAGERKGILLTDQDFSSVTSVAESIYLVGGGTVEPLGPKATPT